MKNQIQDGFTAEKCTFQCAPGYTVKQWNNGVVVCSQFLTVERFKTFFDAVGVAPVILD